MRLLACLLCLTAFAPTLDAQRFHMRSPVHYKQSQDDNAATELNRRLEAGETTLERRGKSGRLRALLRELGVPESSQTLVFSKTSLQRHRISLRTPRALFFGRDTYVGWVRDSKTLEVATTDRNLGIVFYRVSQDPTEQGLLRRDDSCLSCHAGARTGDEPGLVLRSVFPDEEGNPIANAGETLVTLRTPMTERWGGWLVTGKFEGEHRGNGVAERGERRQWQVHGRKAADLGAFADQFDAADYPRSTSDIGALLAFEHQATVHNRLIQATLQMRCLLETDRRVNASLGESGIREQTADIADALAYRIATDLFLGSEAPLTDRAAAPDPGFARDDAALWPEDDDGVRLGRLDLHDSTFELPLSPMVHSTAFAALPDPLRERVLERLWKGLTRGRLPAGVVIPKPKRLLLHEHLRATLPGYDR